MDHHPQPLTVDGGLMKKLDQFLAELLQCGDCWKPKVLQNEDSFSSVK